MQGFSLSPTRHSPSGFSYSTSQSLVIPHMSIPLQLPLPSVTLKWVNLHQAHSAGTSGILLTSAVIAAVVIIISVVHMLEPHNFNLQLCSCCGFPGSPPSPPFFSLCCEKTQTVFPFTTMWCHQHITRFIWTSQLLTFQAFQQQLSSGLSVYTKSQAQTDGSVQMAGRSLFCACFHGASLST